jgi:hypothetical protein
VPNAVIAAVTMLAINWRIALHVSLLFIIPASPQPSPVGEGAEVMRTFFEVNTFFQFPSLTGEGLGVRLFPSLTGEGLGVRLFVAISTSLVPVPVIVPVIGVVWAFWVFHFASVVARYALQDGAVLIEAGNLNAGVR